MKTLDYMLMTIFVSLILVASVNGIASLSHEGTGTTTNQNTVIINITNNITNYVTSWNNFTNTINITNNITQIFNTSYYLNTTNIIWNNFTSIFNLTNNITINNTFYAGNFLNITYNTTCYVNISQQTNNYSNNYYYYMTSISPYLVAGGNTSYINFNDSYLNDTIKNIINSTPILQNIIYTVPIPDNVSNNILITFPRNYTSILIFQVITKMNNTLKNCYNQMLQEYLLGNDTNVTGQNNLGSNIGGTCGVTIFRNIVNNSFIIYDNSTYSGFNGTFKYSIVSYW